MNPMSLISGGAGGLQGGSSSSSGESGPATQNSGTGAKTFNLGGTNPNTAAGALQNPIVLVALVAAVYLVAKR